MAAPSARSSTPAASNAAIITSSSSPCTNTWPLASLSGTSIPQLRSRVIARGLERNGGGRLYSFDQHDGFVAATGNDETNLLSSLLAKSVGATNVVSLIHKFEYLQLVSRVGIDASVSPRISAVNAILRYVRRGNVLSVATLKGIDAEALELDVKAGAKIAGHTLREVDFPDDAVLGIILRGTEVILPRGDDVVVAGDKVIVFALPSALHDIEALFA